MLIAGELFLLLSVKRLWIVCLVLLTGAKSCDTSLRLHREQTRQAQLSVSIKGIPISIQVKRFAVRLVLLSALISLVQLVMLCLPVSSQS